MGIKTGRPIFPWKIPWVRGIGPVYIARARKGVSWGIHGYPYIENNYTPVSAHLSIRPWLSSVDSAFIWKEKHTLFFKTRQTPEETAVHGCLYSGTLLRNDEPYWTEWK